ncbi:MAG: RNA polymerase sigma factor [Prevotella sp.]|nr:RNA polymerase sigma factor [Prevotella sp.]MBQ8488010.1 RNA polymerase sigma factor [Prevotella sp.]
MSRLSDVSLAAQVAVFGNKRAFDQLVRQYQSPVRRFFLSQTLGNEALSDDLAQDTFLKAYTHIGQYRGTSSLLTWLTRIAYNVWYDHCRRQPLAADPLPSAGSREPSAGGSSPVGIDIRRGLSLLREEERTCITLQLIDGYGIDEIAGMTQMPANTVKSHLKRGKEKLANYLRQNGYDR